MFLTLKLQILLTAFLFYVNMIKPTDKVIVLPAIQHYHERKEGFQPFLYLGWRKPLH